MTEGCILALFFLSGGCQRMVTRLHRTETECAYCDDKMTWFPWNSLSSPFIRPSVWGPSNCWRLLLMLPPSDWNGIKFISSSGWRGDRDCYLTVSVQQRVCLSFVKEIFAPLSFHAMGSGVAKTTGLAGKGIRNVGRYRCCSIECILVIVSLLLLGTLPELSCS